MATKSSNFTNKAATLLNKFFIKWYSLSERDRTIIEFVLDIGSAGAVTWLLYHLNCPWWGYVLTLFCVIIQKAITDK